MKQGCNLMSAEEYKPLCYSEQEIDFYTHDWYMTNNIPSLKGPDWRIDIPKYGIYVTGSSPVESILKLDKKVREIFIDILNGRRKSFRLPKKQLSKISKGASKD